jgi:hypothetical protein
MIGCHYYLCVSEPEKIPRWHRGICKESERKQAVQKRIEGKKQRRERNHRLFLAAGLLIEAGLVDTKTGELCYKKDRILQALKELKFDLETSPNPDA